MKSLATMKHSSRSSSLSIERRRIARVPVSFKLMYSGFIRGNLLMGDGTVLDLSKGGLKVRGNYPVQVGMELTMFLYLPDGNDPLFVVEAIVAWTSGNLFGVKFKKMCLREGTRMHAFLRTKANIDG
jgi:hypothetical protein